jgi:hypothetical protein
MCVCQGVNHAAYRISSGRSVPVEEILGKCDGKVVAPNRPRLLPPAPFVVGLDVKLTPKAYEHFRASPSFLRNYAGVVVGRGREWTNYSGQKIVGVRVLTPSYKSANSYHPSFWEAA